MSFYSNLRIYRPGPAPVVDTRSLSAFVRKLVETGALVDQVKPTPSGWCKHKAEIKLGAGLDQDARDLCEEVEFEDCPTMSTFRTQPLDGDMTALTNRELSDKIAALDGTIYRASLRLGQLRGDIFDKLSWLHQEGPHEFRLSLYDISFACGPVWYSDEQTGDLHMLGWCELSLGGSGYFHPWKPPECIARARSIPEIEAMFEVCRSHWPVMPTAPSEEMKHVRRLMARTGAWPYGSVDQPLDWCWGATGLGA